MCNLARMRLPATPSVHARGARILATTARVEWRSKDWGGPVLQVDGYLKDKSKPIWISLSQGHVELYRWALALNKRNCC